MQNVGTSGKQYDVVVFDCSDINRLPASHPFLFFQIQSPHFFVIMEKDDDGYILKNSSAFPHIRLSYQEAQYYLYPVREWVKMYIIRRDSVVQQLHRLENILLETTHRLSEKTRYFFPDMKIV